MMVACNICRNINYSALNLNLESRRRLIVLWFTPIIAEIIDNYPRWTFYTASVCTHGTDLFLLGCSKLQLWREICFVWDNETNRCVICHIKCQRVNRIIGWKKPVNRCGGREGACELPIKGAKIHRGGYIFHARSTGVVFPFKIHRGGFFMQDGVVIFQDIF